MAFGSAWSLRKYFVTIPKKPGPAPRAAEEVRVLGLAGPDQVALGGDELDRLEALGPVAPDRGVPGHAAAEEVAAGLDLRTVAGREGEAVAVERLLDVAVAENGLDDGPALRDVDRQDLVEAHEVDQDPAVAQGRLAPIVAAAADDHLEAVRAGERHRGDDVVLVGRLDDHLRRPVRDQPVPQVPVKGVPELRVARVDDRASADRPQALSIHVQVLRGRGDPLGRGA